MSPNPDHFINEVKAADLTIRYPIRSFLIKIIPAVFMTSYLLLLWNAIPKKGIKVAEMFYLAPLSFPPVLVIIGFLAVLVLNKIFIKNKTPILIFCVLVVSFLFYGYFMYSNHIIPKNYLDIAMLGSAFLMMLQPLYFIIFAKTGFVTINKRKMEINEGVFSRIKDPTDLVNIEDCNKYRSFLQRILGLATLEVVLKRGKEKIFLSFITKEDAESLYDFINAHAFSTSTEYWTTRDRNRNKSKDIKYIDDVNGEDEGEEIEPQE